jgi:hypothetical protein
VLPTGSDPLLPAQLDIQRMQRLVHAPVDLLQLEVAGLLCKEGLYFGVLLFVR